MKKLHLENLRKIFDLRAPSEVKKTHLVYADLLKSSTKYLSSIFVFVLSAYAIGGGYDNPAERHPELINQGYIKVGSLSYIKENPDKNIFSYYFDGKSGKNQLINYLNNELKKNRQIINNTDAIKYPNKLEIMNRRSRSINNLLRSLNNMN